MSEKAKDFAQYNESLVNVLTLSRLGIAEIMARKITKQESIVVPMAAFVIADVLDGVIARKLDVDSPRRRFLDAAVDRLSVLRAASAMYDINPTSRPYLAALAAREAVVSAANLAHYAKSGEVVQGHGFHKLGTLSISAFALGAASGNENVTHALGAASTTINAVLATDYVSNAASSHGDVIDGVRHIAFDDWRHTEDE